MQYHLPERPLEFSISFPPAPITGLSERSTWILVRKALTYFPIELSFE